MDEQAARDTTLPMCFDRYSILGHLATGGMAEVYLAHQAGVRGFEKLVVIKRIRPELVADAGAVEAFLDEARLVAALEHPHIVQVLEVGFVAGSPYFVMEHVDGVDLRQLLEASLRTGRAISLANALYIAIDVCAALHYAHERCDAGDEPLGIIHRDVSPSNVLISHDGGVKICDFGVAKAATRSAETDRGVVKGKYSYMSPEQCTNAPLDRRSDVFALGILLYELTTRAHLFPGTSDFEVMRAIVDRAIPPPSARVHDYPPELEKIVMRALAQDPADRYPTAQALQSDLEELACERRLSMSSTHLAALMNELFPPPAIGVAPKPASSRRSTLRLPRIAPMPVPVRPARSAAVAGISRDLDTVVLPARVLEREVPAKRRWPSVPPVVVQQRRRRSLGWLAGAVLSALVASGAAIAGSHIVDANRRTAVAVLDADAERLAAAVDAAVLRLSAGVPAIGSPHRLEVRGAELFVVADTRMFASLVSSPADGAGARAFSSPAPVARVELAPLKRRLAMHATRASLVLDGTELVLLEGAGTSSMATGVPVAGSELELVASPVAAAAPGWFAPTRYAGVGLAVVLLLGFFVGPRRARRSGLTAGGG